MKNRLSFEDFEKTRRGPNTPTHEDIKEMAAYEAGLRTGIWWRNSLSDSERDSESIKNGIKYNAERKYILDYYVKDLIYVSKMPLASDACQRHSLSKYVFREEK